MKQVNQDKLILGLMVHDITYAVNAAMRIRKMQLKLDFTRHHAEVFFLDAKGNSARYLMANPRTRTSMCCPLKGDFDSLVTDIELRLMKLNARMILTTEKDKNKRTLAKIQVYVAGARTMVLTLAEVVRGSSIIEHEFQTPDGDTP